MFQWHLSTCDAKWRCWATCDVTHRCILVNWINWPIGINAWRQIAFHEMPAGIPSFTISNDTGGASSPLITLWKGSPLYLGLDTLHKIRAKENNTMRYGLICKVRISKKKSFFFITPKKTFLLIFKLLRISNILIYWRHLLRGEGGWEV